MVVFSVVLAGQLLFEMETAFGIGTPRSRTSSYAEVA
jgi:hypothetical protein